MAVIINIKKAFPAENPKVLSLASNGPEDEALDLLHGRGLVRKSTANTLTAKLMDSINFRPTRLGLENMKIKHMM